MSNESEREAVEILDAMYSEGCDWHGPTYQATCFEFHKQSHTKRIAAALTAKRDKVFDECIAIVKQKCAEWAGETDKQWDERPDLAFDAGERARGGWEIKTALEAARAREVGQKIDWREAEHSLSAAYLRLRHKIGLAAFHTPTAPTREQVWEQTELALDLLIEGYKGEVKCLRDTLAAREVGKGGEGCRECGELVIHAQGCSLDNIFSKVRETDTAPDHETETR